MNRTEVMFIIVSLFLAMLWFLKSKSSDQFFNWLFRKKPTTSNELSAEADRQHRERKNLAGEVTEAERKLERERERVTQLKNKLKP